MFDYSHLIGHLSNASKNEFRKYYIVDFILFKYFQLQHSLVGQVPAEAPQARRGDRVPAARRVSGVLRLFTQR